MLPIWTDPDEMHDEFLRTVIIMDYLFNQNVQQGFTMFITFAAIMGGVFITIVILKLYFSGVFSRRSSYKGYRTIGFDSSRSTRRKMKKELKRINYTCQYCKAPLKESTCEYCGRENFRF
ncbi:MAG: hypothetical protein HWN67_20975 [Candidatus Helarchaeota archaeon]|nr:hypothetical protein [Candidatus Helarchaeota archaeon]